MWQQFEGFIQNLFSDSKIQQCGFHLFKGSIDSGGIRVVLWSLYQDFEMAAAQARHTDNHEHPRIVWPSSPMRKPWILIKQDYRGVAGALLPFDNLSPPNVWTPKMPASSGFPGSQV